jgi:hypothetical protein
MTMSNTNHSASKNRTQDSPDLLARYFRDAFAVSLLSREEEVTLSGRI